LQTTINPVPLPVIGISEKMMELRKMYSEAPFSQSIILAFFDFNPRSADDYSFSFQAITSTTVKYSDIFYYLIS